MSSEAFLGPQNAPKSLADGVLPLGQLTALPDPLATFKRATSNPLLLRKEQEMRKGKVRGGAKIIYASGAPKAPLPPLTRACIIGDDSRFITEISVGGKSPEIMYNVMPGQSATIKELIALACCDNSTENSSSSDDHAFCLTYF